MAFVEHRVPGVVQPEGRFREMIDRCAAARAAREAEMARRVEEHVFLETHPVYLALKTEALILRGRPKLSISKKGKNTDAVLSFERKLSLRHMEIAWSSAVVKVERNEDKLSIKLNSGAVPDGIDQAHASMYAMNAVDLPLPRVWTIPDHPGKYLRERLRMGRRRIGLPKTA